MKYDLHTHTTASDGKLSPTELVDYAISKKLKGIAITDHNTVDGIQKAIEYAKDKDIEIVPGIEISCDCEEKVKEVHIVGLFINYNNTRLIEIKNINSESGKKSVGEIIEKLEFLGYEIDFSELEARNSFGKNTIAYLLLEKYPNEFQDRKDVFNKLLGWGQPAMVYGKGLQIKDAIERIHNAGGIAILAHPGQLREFDDYFIEKFISLGGDGLEVGNSYSFLDNRDELNKKYRKIAEDNNLVVSLGTDYHQTKGDKDLGDFSVSEEDFLKIKEKLK